MAGILWARDLKPIVHTLEPAFARIGITGILGIGVRHDGDHITPAGIGLLNENGSLEITLTVGRHRCVVNKD